MGLQVNHPSRTPGAIVCGAHTTVNTGARGGARSTYLGERVEAYDAPLVVDPVQAHRLAADRDARRVCDAPKVARREAVDEVRRLVLRGRLRRGLAVRLGHVLVDLQEEIRVVLDDDDICATRSAARRRR